MEPFIRSFPLEDIRVRAGGDGRTVEAYAAVFDTPTTIRDQDGHYNEVIDRRAFDRTLNQLAPAGSRTNWRVGVLYNHGRTLFGTPSERGAMPIGAPVDIKADNRGLLTVTRYNRTELADEVLENIREGSITAQSFSGGFLRSDPGRPPRGGWRPDSGGNLRTVRRQEVALREYGPTPFPAYPDAAVIGVRAEQAARLLAHLHPDEREQLVEMLRTGTPLETPPGEPPAGPPPAGDPTPGPAAEEPPAGHSARQKIAWAKVRAEIKARRAP
ncbi:HK97 family phage prohead protease [Streptomyces sp. NBC_00582]|uniref:HK97 family phage prohead protease n=1 Tax=Streptomyces sp. NBC_00582 TaxID=2975783 RepID=UPI002E80987D|nr:HK97 family phage prohead protease [Streptomyces sp. NBC_00582]WUB61534.1 HK97 family phage prohead protease [Streptomyces sp. NBC_00582]